MYPLTGHDDDCVFHAAPAKESGFFAIEWPKVEITLLSMRKTLTASALALMSLTTFATAANVAISPGLPGWQELKFDDLTPNQWREEDGAVVVSGSSSVSILYTSANASAAATPILRWKWRVDQGTPATDLGQKGGDDRPISLTVGFAYDSANASFGESMKRVIVENVAGADAPGRVIDLAWGGTAPVGTILESPYSGYSGRIVTMESGAAGGGWVEELIDIAALYRSEWGSEPPPITRIAVSSDGDDTGSTVSARIADIRFEAR